MQQQNIFETFCHVFCRGRLRCCIQKSRIIPKSVCVPRGRCKRWKTIRCYQHNRFSRGNLHLSPTTNNQRRPTRDEERRALLYTHISQPHSRKAFTASHRQQQQPASRRGESRRQRAPPHFLYRHYCYTHYSRIFYK